MSCIGQIELPDGYDVVGYRRYLFDQRGHRVMFKAKVKDLV